MGGDKWSKDVLMFFNNLIFSTSNSTTIYNNIAQGHPTDIWEEDFEWVFKDGVEGPIFHVSAPSALYLHPNEPLPSIDNTKTSQITAAHIGPSSESISTTIQDLTIAPKSDTQDQVVLKHDTNDTDTMIADTTAKPKPKPRPKPKCRKGKTGLDSDNTWKPSKKRSVIVRQ